MNFLKKIAIPALMMAWCTYFIIDAGSPDKKGNTFVWATFVVLAAVFAVELVNELRRAIAEKKANEASAQEKQDNSGLIRSGILFGSTVVYILAMSYIGFMISTFVYLFAMFVFLKAKNKIVVAVASALLTALVWFAFDYLLGVPLPEGIFF